ncbi:MAG: DUF4384 domain-containing protein [Bryobacteraceae bacterium]
MRRILSISAILGVLWATGLMAQAPKKARARDMYFAGLEKVSARKAAPKGLGVGHPGDALPKEPLVVETPLGVRYSVLKYTGQDAVEVSPKTRFHSGDRIQLKVQFNDDGYLYLVHQGTSGAWQLMYPSPRTAHGGNAVVAGREYKIPETSLMRFGGDRGVEKLFLVVSRVPEQKLEELIYSIREEGTTPQAPAPAPAPGAPPLILAGNRPIENPLINQLRTSYTRDLVLEEPAEAVVTQNRGETSVFVVNTSVEADSRVVIDIGLVHE